MITYDSTRASVKWSEFKIKLKCKCVFGGRVSTEIDEFDELIRTVLVLRDSCICTALDLRKHDFRVFLRDSFN